MKKVKIYFIHKYHKLTETPAKNKKQLKIKKRKVKFTIRLKGLIKKSKNSYVSQGVKGGAERPLNGVPKEK